MRARPGFAEHRMWPLLILALVASGQDAFAQSTRKPAAASPAVDPVVMQGGFLSGHPDLNFRQLGLEAYDKGAMRDAFRFFQRASLYGDKPSQGMVGEMLWRGQGVAEDRALGYAWMDLAAERGYRDFVVMRERYWNALDERQRERALAEGQSVYAKYGDDVATPRLAQVLRRASRSTTGSRTGFVGSLKIYVPGLGGDQVIDGSQFYDPKYWDPVRYRAWQDEIWSAPRTGRVSVGDVETLRERKTDEVKTEQP